MVHNMEHRAKEYATLCHERAGQLRKYTGEPYITHPAAVAEIVRGVAHTPEMIAAAWLHDVTEDTEATLDEIERIFGFKVASLVEMLSDVSKPSDGNRAARKAIDFDHTAKASKEAKTIKLADIIHNCCGISDIDPKYATVYLAEKEVLLGALADGDEALLAQAFSIIRSEKAKLQPRRKR